MCGIAGFAGRDGRAAIASVERMIDSLALRGPDGEGLQAWNAAALGHRRLAIFDLSEAGRQPMLTPDGRTGVVFNGAIYNFQDLRRELDGRGFAFRTATDTEVLLHGYREWGIEGLVRRLRGMFAFALWDDDAETLHLVRDRLGVKPLIWAENAEGVFFASTARALRDAGIVGEIDPEAVKDFLRFGYVSEDRVIYRGAHKVPAASIVTWRAGRRTEASYWSPLPAPIGRPISFDEALEETERLFLESVALRLQADVPVGVLLSSGIDSSLVCWAVAKLGVDITAFTVGVPGDPWDETEGACATARAIGIRHRVLPMAEPSIAAIADLTEAFAEPFAAASALGMIAISGAVAEQATVLLTGDGGDDVFLGYPRHRHLYLAEQIARHLPLGAASQWPLFRAAIPPIGALRRARALGDYAMGGEPEVERAGSSLEFYRQSGILGPRLEAAPSPDGNGAARWSIGRGRSVLEDNLRHAYRTRFLAEYMTKVDGSTMHHGLEARAPFLDQELWTFVASLPPSVRLRGYRLKALLRALAEKRIGAATARRRKQGFGIPAARWLTGRWYEEARAFWPDSVAQREGWIRGDALMRRLAASRAAGAAPLELWYLLVLELWLRRETSTGHARRRTAASTA